MKFVIEALGLTAGGGKELGLDLLSRLCLFDQHQFVLLLPDTPEYRSLSHSNAHCIFRPPSQNLLERFWTLHRVVPRICESCRADALLCLGNFTPRRVCCPLAVLVHSPYLAYREPVAELRLSFREKLIANYGAFAMSRLGGRTQVIVQSPIMKERFVAAHSIEQQRVNVIPNAPNGTLPGLSTAEVPPEDAGVFTFLCLTRYYPHKNLEVLPEALRKLRERTKRAFKCVITISAHQHAGARALLDRIRREDLGKVLHNIGPVPHSKLAEVYRSAHALVLPTLLESYSRTYSEAMSSGLPILTSDRDFAHHLCGDAAVYFDPLNADSVADCMAKIMENRDLRHQLVRNGRKNLRLLPSWDEIAALFIAVLERAARRHSALRKDSATSCLSASGSV